VPQIAFYATRRLHSLTPGQPEEGGECMAIYHPLKLSPVPGGPSDNFRLAQEQRLEFLRSFLVAIVGLTASSDPGLASKATADLLLTSIPAHGSADGANCVMPLLTRQGFRNDKENPQ
jgi:hypothetical protein